MREVYVIIDNNVDIAVNVVIEVCTLVATLQAISGRSLPVKKGCTIKVINTMDNIKITIEGSKYKDVIVLTENNIILDGKNPTIDDCAVWYNIFSEIGKLFAIYAREIVENTVNNITKL